MKEISKDYLWTFELEGINNKILFNTCYGAEQFILKKFGKPQGDNYYGCATSYHHKLYNLLTFPCAELQNFYFKLNKAISQVVIPNKRYYIRCWANLFKKGSNIDWHNHWPAELKTYHGFYCVNTEGEIPSYTTYRIPGEDKEIVVNSKNGLLVFGKSENDEHKSSPWENEGKSRVTIAFDVIPIEAIVSPLNFNFDGLLINNYFPMLTHMQL